MRVGSAGLLIPQCYQPSLHCDMRPLGTVIDMIVIHNISLPPGEYGSGAIEQFFCGTLDYNQHPYFATLKALRVTAHVLITRMGFIRQFVPFHQRAWHAGVSRFQDKENCNDFSIGIELEGTDDEPYEDRQYQQLADLVTLLMNTYPAITVDRIVGHNMIAPDRKTDPGPAFAWDYLRLLMLKRAQLKE